MRDTFNMDHSRHPDSYDIKKPFLKLSRITFFLLLVIFLCSLIAVALLVYNFAVCPTEDNQSTCNSQYQHHLNGNFSPVSTTSDEETTQPVIFKDVRLPRSVKPVSYDIVIAPNLNGENFTFKGYVAIKIHIHESCTNISLHSWALKISRNQTALKMMDENGDLTSDEIEIKNQQFVDEKQFLVIETKQELKKGKNYLLKLKYTGQITDNLQGFYKSSYITNGKTKWLTSTQFQATDARRAFPW